MFVVEKTEMMEGEEVRIVVRLECDDISQITGVVYKKFGQLYINYFYVNPELRGKRYGMKLLNKIIDVSQSDYNIKKVCLDDESSRYRKPNNIYIKKGFHYVNANSKYMELNV